MGAFSLISVIAISIPKLYAMGLTLVLMFNCGQKAREEDVRRRWTHRLLAFNEFRLLALNVEYTKYQKEKYDLLMALMKFFVEDGP